MRKIFSLCALALIFSACAPKHEPYRILSCGIRHESNTFSTITTSLNDFTVWRGQRVIEEKAPWSEYLLKQKDVELIPTTHAYAWPGGIVEKEAYEQFKSEILQGIKEAGKLDGIYMDMHGALHVQGYEDAQYDLVSAIRDLIGAEPIISASFDLHGNVSDEFLSGLNLVTAYRTAPHRDGKETKLRAVKNLLKVLRSGVKPEVVRVEIPILVPGEKSITEVEPMHSLYEQLYSIEKKEGIIDASILVGYAWADLPRSAMRVFVVCKDSSYVPSAKTMAENLATDIWNARYQMEMDVESGSIEEMIRRAYELPQSTVFISDSGDNTTAGSPGDNPQVIKALLDAKAQNALFAGLVDSLAFEQCHVAGEGAELCLSVGGKKDYIFGSPLKLNISVKTITENSILVNAEGLDIALLKKRDSFTTKKQFSDLGIDPLTYKVVVVKLGYLYPELRDLAPVHLIALTPGFCSLDMCALPYKRANLRSYPLTDDVTWEPIAK